MVTQGWNDAKVFIDSWEEIADNPSAWRESTSEVKSFIMHSGALLWKISSGLDCRLSRQAILLKIDLNPASGYHKAVPEDRPGFDLLGAYWICKASATILSR